MRIPFPPRPTIEGDTVRIGAWSLRADKPRDIVLSDFQFTPRFGEFQGARAKDETVWCIDFVLADVGGASFRIEKSNTK